MNTSELVYEGDLRTLATHVYSGATLNTDAPLDNFGKAQFFSPTDLVATALASCIITTIAILMKSENIDWTKSKLGVRKVMSSNPRRISAIEIDFDLTQLNLSEEQKIKLEEIAHECPVARSLNAELKQEIRFMYA